jgi:parallel beta-helix repeat protein
MRRAVASLGLTLAAVIVAGRACGAEYWVAPGWRDFPAGGTAPAPWATLQYAADRVGPGDTVTVRPGRYAGFVLGWDRPQGGAEGRPVTFRGESFPVIAGRNAKTPDGINLEGASYVVIEGFRVDGVPRAGIRSARNRGVVIRGNRADRNGKWGIFTSFSEGVRIEGNSASRSADEHGIYVSNTCSNPVVRGNDAWGNSQCGIHLNGDASQGGDGVISRALIERNTIHDNGRKGGAGVNADGVRDSMIRNNLLYDNHARGIALFREDAAAGSANNLVVNNTVVQPADARWAVVIRGGSTGNTVANNILLSYSQRFGAILVADDSRPGLMSDFNVLTPRLSTDGDEETVTDLSRWRSYGFDRHGVAARPEAVFADIASGDFRPRTGSPAIGAARPAWTPADDLAGLRRPEGEGPDAGAYEFRPEPGRPGQPSPKKPSEAPPAGPHRNGRAQ